MNEADNVRNAERDKMLYSTEKICGLLDGHVGI